MTKNRRTLELDEFGHEPPARFGELYQYDLVNYPFLGSRTVVGTRYIVYANAKDGTTASFKSTTKQDAINAYKAALANGDVTSETTVNYDEVHSSLDENWSAFEKVLCEDWVDLGTAVPPTDIGSALTALIKTIEGWFGIK